MKKLLITLLLISPASFADWGDVYYCQMTSYGHIESDGTVKQYTLEKFQFKLDEDKKAMVFGKDGYFADSKQLLDLSRSGPTIETWWATDKYSIIYFAEGNFLYANNSAFLGIKSIVAGCDKF